MNASNDIGYVPFKPGPLPYVTQSFGMSLDGKIATRTGDSKYISGEEARVFVHRLRNAHDGILVGINTILIDRPKLTTRLPEGGGRNPHRIILDSTLRLPPDGLLAGPGPERTYVVCRDDADPERRRVLEALGARIVAVPDPRTSEGLRTALARLREEGVGSLLVEGGSTVHYAFLAAGLSDRIFAFIAPLIIGGETAKGAVGGEGFATLREAAHLEFRGWRQLGDDLVVEAVPASHERKGA